jgi:hypothetical protein
MQQIPQRHDTGRSPTWKQWILFRLVFGFAETELDPAATLLLLGCPQVRSQHPSQFSKTSGYQDEER